MRNVHGSIMISCLAFVFNNGCTLVESLCLRTRSMDTLLTAIFRARSRQQLVKDVEVSLSGILTDNS